MPSSSPAVTDARIAAINDYYYHLFNQRAWLFAENYRFIRNFSNISITCYRLPPPPIPDCIIINSYGITDIKNMSVLGQNFCFACSFQNLPCPQQILLSQPIFYPAPFS